MSVILPTRNRSRLASRAVNIALTQMGVSVEVIVVDDRSEPPLKLVAGATQAGLRLVRTTNNTGAGAARNAGITCASGRWLAFLDDDDLWSPDKLRKQLEIAEAIGADFVYSAAIRVDPDGRGLEDLVPPEPSALLPSMRRYNALPSGPSNVIVRADVIRQLGGFCEELSFYADWDMWLRLAAVSVGARDPSTSVAYVDHLGSMTWTPSFDVRGEIDVLRRRHPGLFREDSGDAGAPPAARLIARHESLKNQRLSAASGYWRAARASRSVADVGRAVVSLVGRKSVLAASQAVTRYRGWRRQGCAAPIAGWSAFAGFGANGWAPISPAWVATALEDPDRPAVQ